MKYRDKREYNRKYYKLHRKERNIINRASHKRRRKDPEVRLKETLKYSYGLSFDRYKEMLGEQSGRCAICRRLPAKTFHGNQRLQVDHCHRTERVRGLLCN